MSRASTTSSDDLHRKYSYSYLSGKEGTTMNRNSYGSSTNFDATSRTKEVIERCDRAMGAVEERLDAFSNTRDKIAHNGTIEAGLSSSQYYKAMDGSLAMARRLQSSEREKESLREELSRAVRAVDSLKEKYITKLELASQERERMQKQIDVLKEELENSNSETSKWRSRTEYAVERRDSVVVAAEAMDANRSTEAALLRENQAIQQSEIMRLRHELTECQANVDTLQAEVTTLRERTATQEEELVKRRRAAEARRRLTRVLQPTGASAAYSAGQMARSATRGGQWGGWSAPGNSKRTAWAARGSSRGADFFPHPNSPGGGVEDYYDDLPRWT